MIDDDSSIILFKFGKNKWMEQIKNGYLSFGTIGSYIDIAVNTSNNEQGDDNEAIFARIKKDDPRVEKMKAQLGIDLEIIEDGDYVKLRRKSSYFIPCFCFYSYKARDIVNHAEGREGYQTVKHCFDERIFKSFSESEKIKNVLANDERYAQLIIRPKPFKYAVCASLVKLNERVNIKDINYDLLKNDEFFIEPTKERKELFYKYPKYKYQHEARICLINKRVSNINDRFELKLDSFIKNEIILTNSKLYFKTNVVIEKKK